MATEAFPTHRPVAAAQLEQLRLPDAQAGVHHHVEAGKVPLWEEKALLSVRLPHGRKRRSGAGLTLMNVGFHTLKVTFTWLLLFSGREQLNEAHSRYLQLWAANHSV